MTKYLNRARSSQGSRSPRRSRSSRGSSPGDPAARCTGDRDPAGPGRLDRGRPTLRSGSGDLLFILGASPARDRPARHDARARAGPAGRREVAAGDARHACRRARRRGGDRPAARRLAPPAGADRRRNGICGASAIAAIAGIVEATSAEVAYAISTIFVFISSPSSSSPRSVISSTSVSTASGSGPAPPSTTPRRSVAAAFAFGHQAARRPSSSSSRGRR